MIPQAPPVRVEGVDVLPIQPRVEVLKVKHIDTLAGVNTIIGRKVERPETCRRCRGIPCAHDGGFCVVVAPEYVSTGAAAGYVLDARPDEGSTGLGIKRG